MILFSPLSMCNNFHTELNSGMVSYGVIIMRTYEAGN